MDLLTLKNLFNRILPISFKKIICMLILALINKGFIIVALLQVELPMDLLKTLIPESFLL